MGDLDLPWYSFVLLISPLAAIAFVLLRVLYTQVQAHLLEFMLILIVSTLPMGVMLNLAAHSGYYSSSNEARAVLGGLFPLLLIFAGSLWALSSARRLGEERTWHRLGLLLVGWLIVPSIVCLIIGWLALIACILDFFLLPRPEELSPWLVWLLPGSAPLFMAIAIERKCRAKACERPP